MPILRLLFISLVILVIWPTRSIAGDVIYKRYFLDGSFSIEAPSHWIVHSDSERRNFAAAAEGTLKKPGVRDYSGNDKYRILAISSLPAPSGAKIRVNIITPTPFSSNDIKGMNPKDLKDSEKEVSETLKESLAGSGMDLLSFSSLSIETVNGNPALLLEYRRSDLYGSSPWIVKQYKIPLKNKLVELTISYRESDMIIWIPTLDYVKKSIMF